MSHCSQNQLQHIVQNLNLFFFESQTKIEHVLYTISNQNYHLCYTTCSIFFFKKKSVNHFEIMHKTNTVNFGLRCSSSLMDTFTRMHAILKLIRLILLLCKNLSPYNTIFQWIFTSTASSLLNQQCVTLAGTSAIPRKSKSNTGIATCPDQNATCNNLDQSHQLFQLPRIHHSSLMTQLFAPLRIHHISPLPLYYQGDDEKQDDRILAGKSAIPTKLFCDGIRHKAWQTSHPECNTFTLAIMIGQFFFQVLSYF